MKKLVSALLTCALVFSLAACGAPAASKAASAVASKAPSAAATQYKDMKIALVSDTIGTEQFILQAFNALKEAEKKYGFKAISIECASTADWAEKTRGACVEGYNLIIGIGWVAAEPFSKLADEFPNIKFAVVDTIAKNEKIKSVAFNTSDGCYVLGAMAAAAFPQETKFGYIGNFKQQSNFEYKYGFMEGVKSLIPSATFMTNYTESYSDTSIAYNLAMQQAAAGCKFIMGSVASSANQGIYKAALDQAAKKTPFYTTGLSVDQTTADNPYIIGGVTKNTGIVTTKIIEEFLTGKFKPGKEILGFTDGAFGVVGISSPTFNFRNKDIVTDKVLEAGKKAAEDLKSGKVKLTVPIES